MAGNEEISANNGGSDGRLANNKGSDVIRGGGRTRSAIHQFQTHGPGEEDARRTRAPAAEDTDANG